MLETGINIIEWPSLQYCTMTAFGGDALQRKAMSHKSSFIIIDISSLFLELYIGYAHLKATPRRRTLFGCIFHLYDNVIRFVGLKASLPSCLIRTHYTRNIQAKKT